MNMMKIPDDALVMYKEDLQKIGGDVNKYGDIETGGALFGGTGYNNNTVVFLSTLPSPFARHLYAHFEEDHRWFQMFCRQIATYHHLRFVGRWHSHGAYLLNHPSSDDITAMKSIAQKNNFKKMYDLIFTFDTKGMNVQPHQLICEHSSDFSRNLNFVGHHQNIENSDFRAPKENFFLHRYSETKVPHIRMHSYIYDDAPKGRYHPCSILLLEGKSPLRANTRQRSALLDAKIYDKSMHYPIDCITYNACESELNPAIYDDNWLPDWLMSELDELPEEQKDTLSVQIRDYYIISIKIGDATIILFYPVSAERCRPQFMFIKLANFNKKSYLDISQLKIQNAKECRMINILRMIKAILKSYMRHLNKVVCNNS
ncbi:MAG: Mov34/MPN/PAD-1 family protein [Candidatus Omnitrophica bacterium]|nr:Mov34/MPN/PAD-1 family protein [Candidatus Omnitrophota bacterium]